MSDRRLGDVPGDAPFLPDTNAILPNDASVLEVNGVGEVTADEAGIGDVTSDYSTDPFAFRPESTQAVEGSGVRDPMAHLHAPQVDGSGGSMSSSDLSGSTNTYAGDPVGSYTPEQMDNAQVIADAGKEVGASTRDIQIALMAAMVESNLQNLSYGDRDSVGLFQQRDAWGSFEDRTTPAAAAKMFFLGGKGGQRGLLDFKDRDKMSMGEAAQSVQVSAFPDRYAEHEADAATLLGAVTATVTHGKLGNDPYGLIQRDGETVDNMTAAALDAAAKSFGSNFTIMQGSHSTDVSASGSTHAGGGVVDVSVPNGDWAGAVAALRKIGFAAWVRNVPGYGSAGEGAHIHAVLIGNKELSPQAQVQVQSYMNNDDGLAGTRADDGPREFVNNRFSWGDATKEPKAPADPWRSDVVANARGLLGTNFKWGGEDHGGVDTVGLIRRVYKDLGVTLPRTKFGLAYATDPIPIDQLRPGDLVAWDKHPELGTDHVGIYLGDGNMIEAARPGQVVQINTLGEAALSAWGVPMAQLIKQAQPAAVAPVSPAHIPHSPAAPASPSPVIGGSDQIAPHVPPSNGGGGGGGGGNHQHHDNPDVPYHPLPGGYS